MKKLTINELDMKKLSWNDLFDSEEELIESMLRCPTTSVNGRNVPKGYEYIEGFQRYYKKNGELTKKQMTQLKRLAKNIYASVNDMKVYSLLVSYPVSSR